MPQSPSFNLTATGAAKETTYGVPIATPTIWLSMSDITMTDTNELLERASARQQIGREEAETGAFGGAGSFTAECDPDVVGIPLAWGMGAEVIAASPSPRNPIKGLLNVTITSTISAGATTIPVSDGTQFVAGNSYIFGAGTANAELLLVSAIAGNNLTTPATAHSHNGGVPVWNSFSTAFDHTLTFGIPRPSFTVQFQRITDNIQFAGCKVSTIDISMAPRQMQQVKFGVVYAQSLTDTANTPAFSAQRPWRVIDPLSTVLVNGIAPTAGMLSANVSINSGLAPSEYVIQGGRIINGIPELMARVTGSFVMQYTSTQMMQLFWGIAGATGPQASVTGVSLAFTLVSPSLIQYVGGAVVPTAGAPYQIQIILPNCKLTAAPTPGRSGSLLQQTVNFEAYESLNGAMDDCKMIVTTGSPLAS